MAGRGMALSAPKQITFIIALVVGLLGILGYFVLAPFVSLYAFWLVVIAFALLVLGSMLDGI